MGAAGAFLSADPFDFGFDANDRLDWRLHGAVKQVEEETCELNSIDGINLNKIDETLERPAMER